MSSEEELPRLAGAGACRKLPHATFAFTACVFRATRGTLERLHLALQ